MTLRKRIFEIIEKAHPGDRASQAFNHGIVALILLNIAAVIASSFNDLPKQGVALLNGFELFSVIVFSIEYVLRIATADLLYPDSRHPRLRYVFSFMAIIDLLAILPFYLPLLIRIDLRFLRILRLFRLLRIFKLNRYSRAMGTIGGIIKKEKDKLGATLFIIAILLILSASMMYYAENEAQPDKFPNILASIWWAIATLTTVGYGDVYPVTSLGKLMSGIIMLLGVGLIALPTGIISSGFVSEVKKEAETEHRRCPHCGKDLD